MSSFHHSQPRIQQLSIQEARLVVVESLEKNITLQIGAVLARIVNLMLRLSSPLLLEANIEGKSHIFFIFVSQGKRRAGNETKATVVIFFCPHRYQHDYLLLSEALGTCY